MEVQYITNVEPDQNSGTTVETFSGTVFFMGRLEPIDDPAINPHGLTRDDTDPANAEKPQSVANVIAALQDWVTAGNTIPAYVPPTPEEMRYLMPDLTARQFRLGLIDSGRTIAQVETAIAAIEDDGERATAEIEWEYATEFKRSHPLVVSLSAALGFTPEEVDTLWQSSLQL